MNKMVTDLLFYALRKLFQADPGVGVSPYRAAERSKSGPITVSCSVDRPAGEVPTPINEALCRRGV